MTPELQAAVERVARALCENALGPKRCPCFGKPFKCGDAHPAHQALAAIRAVAEATVEHPEPDTLREAVLDALSNGEGECRERDMPKVWRAMHAASILGAALRDE